MLACAGLYPIDLVMFSQASQHRIVQLLPHPGGLSITQSTPACHATAKTHGLRQVLLRDTCLKNEQDPIEGSLTADRGLARASLAGWGKGGKQGL